MGKSSQTTVSNRGQKTRCEKLIYEPATTHPSPSVAFAMRLSSSFGFVSFNPTQPGRQLSASNSTNGTCSTVANRLPRVLFPEQLLPTTWIRRPIRCFGEASFTRRCPITMSRDVLPVCELAKRFAEGQGVARRVRRWFAGRRLFEELQHCCSVPASRRRTLVCGEDVQHPCKGVEFQDEFLFAAQHSIRPPEAIR